MGAHPRFSTPAAIRTIAAPGLVSGRALACVVVDADMADGLRLVDLLAVDGSVSVLGRDVSGQHVARLLRNAAVQVLFIDARLPSDSLQAVERRASHDAPLIVITSAVASDAAIAFSLGASGFLAKPYLPSRVQATLAHLRSRLDELDVLERVQSVATGDPSRAPASVAARDELHPSTPAEELIGIPVGSGTAFLPHGAIEYVTAQGYESWVHTTEGVLIARLSLSALEQRMGSGRLFRVHRGASINLVAARHLRRDAAGQARITLTSGESVRVAKRRCGALRRALARLPLDSSHSARDQESGAGSSR